MEYENNKAFCNEGNLLFVKSMTGKTYLCFYDENTLLKDLKSLIGNDFIFIFCSAVLQQEKILQGLKENLEKKMIKWRELPMIVGAIVNIRD